MGGRGVASSINDLPMRSDRMRPRMAWDHLFSFIQVSLIYEEGSDSMMFIQR